MASAHDVYETTTAAIVRAIEEGAGTWRMPWLADGLAFPMNPTTGKRYRGGNVLTLWITALDRDYLAGEWATYKQCHAFTRARGLTVGHVFATDGTHAATFAQEFLAREVAR